MDLPKGTYTLNTIIAGSLFIKVGDPQVVDHINHDTLDNQFATSTSALALKTSRIEGNTDSLIKLLNQIHNNVVKLLMYIVRIMLLTLQEKESKTKRKRCIYSNGISKYYLYHRITFHLPFCLLSCAFLPLLLHF